MIADVISELGTDITKAHESLKRELTKIRTGRAHPSLLESVRVEVYGSQMPLSQLATVAVPEARMLTVKPWDKTQLKVIEKAIVQSPLGLNPMSDGDILRIPMPPLTEERRKELAKLVKKHGEETKVAIRKARHDAKDLLSSLEKDKQISEDELERAEKKVEELIKDGVAEVDAIVARKDKDLLEV
ncbi:MAG TPA: ribosome recycling factor [Polyangiales bacterium]|jgi:ribosome recycling factor|nr:ribosome recycling factor [Polyangiales bacterium]